jgi:hypothetical protein
MARGKHGHASSRRRASLAQARLEALRGELEGEQAALAEAELATRAVDGLREQARTESIERDRSVGAQVKRLENEADALNQAVKQARATSLQVQQAWEKASDAVIDALGGGRDGIERFMSIVGQGGYISDNPAERRLDHEAIIRLQYLRGARKRGPTEADGEKRWGLAAHAGMFARQRRLRLASKDTCPTPDMTAEQVAALEELISVTGPLLKTHPTTLQADALYAWHPLPWVQGVQAAEQDVVFKDLGFAAGTGEISAPVLGDDWPAPSAALAATIRERLSHRDVDELVEEWRDRLILGEALVSSLGDAHSDFSVGPQHPRPGRAATLRHLYAKSSIGTWSRALETGSDGAWAGNLAVAMTTATAFWLPAGQTFSFADSEPLTEEDADSLRLPFPQVFLAFAEPLSIQAVRAPSEDEVRALEVLDLAARRMFLKSSTDLGALFSEAVDALGALDLEQVLQVRGGRVEGVLLLADSLGRLTDNFAWCVRLPSGATKTLGRHVIPARVSKTRHAALLRNLIAVTAWADWHEPDVAAAVPSGTSVRDAIELLGTDSMVRDINRTGGGSVRVLNVRSTVGSSGHAEPTGRIMAPHVRRGHWRRQRHGPGRLEIKRIRIAPVAVNAGRGDALPRVYVLPRPGGGQVG